MPPTFSRPALARANAVHSLANHPRTKRQTTLSGMPAP